MELRRSVRRDWFAIIAVLVQAAVVVACAALLYAAYRAY
jgi:hypothetical protein